MKCTFVTGGTGFLGRHLVSRLEAAGHDRRGATVGVDAICCSSDSVLDFLAREHPDRVFHSAAYYGGIGINVVEPATLYFRNLVMGANLMEAARLVDGRQVRRHRHGVQLSGLPRGT